ncbi:MAG TPA: putative lipid II flippase FtsW [Verrucomicrobiae bacterium]|nr:putative lipid II flippase FtsW [Verrucomicrobiae bacterium]
MKFAITTLATCVAALLMLGLVMLYSASMNMPDKTDKTRVNVVGANLLKAQAMWCALGLVACAVAASLDYRLLRKFAWPLFGVTIVLLAPLAVGALLKLPIPYLCKPVNGAWRWFNLGGVSFQPSELAKVTLIIMLAWYCERNQRQMHTWLRGLVFPAIIIGLPLGLIFVEPDRGTTVLLAAVAGTMLLVAGVQWRYIVPTIVLAMVGLAFSLWHDPVRRGRILSWLAPEATKQGVGYQADQAMIALGSGGWFGLGLGNGRQKLGFVPEHHTDFILSIIGEELGLMATVGVIIGFVLIVICGVYIATHARDTFGTMLATGITFLIGLQAFINIGVVTSALPNKGLALPFISYGGSSLLAMLGCIGLLLSVARQAREGEVKTINPFAAGELPSTQTS